MVMRQVQVERNEHFVTDFVEAVGNYAASYCARRRSVRGDNA
jgi:hypothetical protein